MRELQSVIAEFERADAAGTPLVLATVVHVEGSTYRRPGARLLVSENRWLAGGVSGGCLEGDVLQRALWRTAAGRAVLVEYDSRVDDESAWTHALGCNGLVEVLLERITPDAAIHPVRTLGRWLRSESAGVLVTVFRTPPTVTAIGARIALGPDGAVADCVGGRASELLLAEARSALVGRDSRVVRVELPEGSVEALVEVFVPPPRLVVFGEGPDVAPVLEAAAALGWRTTLVITRHTPSVAKAEAAATEVVVCNADSIREQVPLHGASAAVLMTHAYARDRAVLEAVLATSMPYVGVLGPRRRTDKLLHDLARERPVPAEALARIFSPVGLDLGAEEPEEIALSIVAENPGRAPRARRRIVAEDRGPHPWRGRVTALDRPLSRRDARVAAVVLAAGASRRLGRPKQLVPFRGEPLVRRAAYAALGAGADPVVTVIRSGDDAVAAILSELPVELVENADAASGMASSVRSGVAHLRSSVPDLGAVLLLTCDQPLVDAAYLESLLHAWRRTGRPIVASEYGGLPGVPVVMSAELVDELLAVEGDTGARDVVRRDPERVATVPFPGGEVDVDTALDLERLGE